MRGDVRAVVLLWGIGMSGVASAVWAFYQEVVDLAQQSRWGKFSLWVYAYACLIFVACSLYRKLANRVNELEARLKPDLEILSSVPRTVGNHQRIKVHNKSAITIRFSVRVVSVEPPLARYDKIPNWLQIDDSDPPYKEANIGGGGDALVNVVVWYGDDPAKKERLYGLTIASPAVMGNPSAGAIPLARTHYRIRVQAFPVSPQGPPSKARDFYITPQADGALLLSDAGEVTQSRL